MKSECERDSEEEVEDGCLFCVLCFVFCVLCESVVTVWFVLKLCESVSNSNELNRIGCVSSE